MSLKQVHFKELESTQDKAFELLESGEEPPFLVSADFQTKGRGRKQRDWHMEKGRSLAFTILIRMQTQNLSGLSLVVGLAIRDALNRDDIFLKWPNDLMINEDKVAGILVESRSQGDRFDIALGVGLNFLNMQLAPYKGIEERVNVMTLAHKIEDYMHVFQGEGFASFQSNYEKWMWHRNKTAALSVNGVTSHLILKGVSLEGCLITEEGGQLKLNSDGEIILQSDIEALL